VLSDRGLCVVSVVCCQVEVCVLLVLCVVRYGSVCCQVQVCVVSVVCCLVEVCASGLSLFQSSPTDCGVSEYDRDASILKPCPTGGGGAVGHAGRGRGVVCVSFVIMPPFAVATFCASGD
jgi:hypothetical protein